VCLPSALIDAGNYLIHRHRLTATIAVHRL
jgi:hypothetical protein